MSDKHYVITIERQYGSGGRIVGRKLAEELGLHFYDDEILKMASEKSAVGEEFFRLADEKAGNNLLHRLAGARAGHHPAGPGRRAKPAVARRTGPADASGRLG